MAESFKYGNGVWATKTGSSLAYNDENDNYKPLPFSVTRDSIATRVNKQGLIEVVGKDKLRIDYTDSTKGVALLEPARTNLFPQSNKFDTDWVLNNITVTSGQTGVGGNSEAWKITANSGSGEKRLNKNLSVSGNHAVSIYAKKGTRNYVWIRGVVGGSNKRTFFNLDTGTIHTDDNVSSNIIDMGDGWYRCEVVINQQSGFEFFIGIAEDDNTPDYNDDGTGSIYVQYAQAEAGSYATSYIPTSGSTVTRAADVANGAGNSEVFNDSEGVLFADVSTLVSGSETRVISLSSGSQSVNNIYLNFNSSGTLSSQVLTSGGNVTLSVPIIKQTFQNKIAVKYKANDCALWLNGFEIDTDTSISSTPTGLNRLNFDFGAGSFDFYGKAKRIGVYDAVLTDAELEALTSYTSFTNMANELNLTIK